MNGTIPALVAAIGALRRRGGRFMLLFHDTHHRAVSDPEAIRAFDLTGYDGVLAFGETLRDVYRRWGWGDRVLDLARGGRHPPVPPARQTTASGEASSGSAIGAMASARAEIEDFLLRPAAETGLQLDIYGVRYPDEALAMLAAHGARYRGWAPNARVPEVFARQLATVHVPRRYYSTMLPGIPTIRVFEALACGMPLVSAPWDDAEHLFRPGNDYLVAPRWRGDDASICGRCRTTGLARRARGRGLETIRARHTCAHRVDELLAIVAALDARRPVKGDVA